MIIIDSLYECCMENKVKNFYLFFILEVVPLVSRCGTRDGEFTLRLDKLIDLHLLALCASVGYARCLATD